MVAISQEYVHFSAQKVINLQKLSPKLSHDYNNVNLFRNICDFLLA